MSECAPVRKENEAQKGGLFYFSFMLFVCQSSFLEISPPFFSLVIFRQESFGFEKLELIIMWICLKEMVEEFFKTENKPSLIS